MSKHVELPRVYPKGRWYYQVTTEGKKRVWAKLTKIRDGIPALYQKLADLHARDVAPDRIPALVADWLTEVSTEHSKKTQSNDKWVMGVISTSLAEFRASQVKPPDVATFLKPFRSKSRTHNEMRAGVRELMRYAEEEGYRGAGTDLVESIKTVSAPARDKYVSDSELRRIKLPRRRDYRGKITSTGPMVCAAIDMAYLSGQRVSDILGLRWTKKLAQNKEGKVVAPYIADEGIYFKPSKTTSSTGAKVLIAWTPSLVAVVARLRAFKRRNTHWVFTTEDAQPYTYSGFFRRWKRAVKNAGVHDCHFNDLRAKAITDKEESHGMQQARRMGAHSTEAQTADYVRHRKAQVTEATR